MRKELDRVYSLYIRLRDAEVGGMTRCISCGKLLPFEKMQCGHYFSRYNLSTRWDERNCNAECAICNCNDPNHLIGYKKNLIRKIGQAEFDELERLHYEMGEEPSQDEYKALIKGYKDCCRKLARYKDIDVRI
jgi:hypothetical protein